MFLRKSIFLFLILISFSLRANFILLPMDETTQKNHLKAYGITYWCVEKSYKASWLLNYRGGSFLLPDARSCTCEIAWIAKLTKHALVF